MSSGLIIRARLAPLPANVVRQRPVAFDCGRHLHEGRENMRLDHEIERIGKEHGIDVFASMNRAGGVYTTPPSQDWPDAMTEAVKAVAIERNGPYGYYWVAK